MVLMALNLYITRLVVGSVAKKKDKLVYHHETISHLEKSYHHQAWIGAPGGIEKQTYNVSSAGDNIFTPSHDPFQVSRSTPINWGGMGQLLIATFNY